MPGLQIAYSYPGNSLVSAQTQTKLSQPILLQSAQQMLKRVCEFLMLYSHLLVVSSLLRLCYHTCATAVPVQADHTSCMRQLEKYLQVRIRL